MSSLSWSVILLINEVFVQLRFSGEKKNTKMTSNQVDISRVKFHSSHSKGPRQQFLSRIVLAQSPCHIAFKAFRSILTIAMYRCTIITLLLYFNFEVLILSQLAATMHPLWVEFKYTVRGKGIITCNRDWWEGVWGVWGVWVRSNLPQKSSTVLSEPKFAPLPAPPPSNQKFLDPPLLFTYFRLPFPLFDAILRSE